MSKIKSLNIVLFLYRTIRINNSKILSGGKIPYIYLNLELNFTQEFDNSYSGKLYIILKNGLTRKRIFSIIQDEE
jgi:hypothetical protein